MKTICPICAKVSINNNLWCQRLDCPIGHMSEMMGYGEPFGDLEIVRPLTVLRSAALYEAQRDDTKVLLKIAHDGFHNKLKREAEFLSQLQQQGINHPVFPHLLPAHPETTHTYGKTSVGKRIKYYTVLAYVEGELLSEVLLKTPQPWFKHVGWIGLSLAGAIDFLHEHQKLHLTLYPEAIRLFFDEQNVPRMKLLDLGWLVWPTPDGCVEEWIPRSVPYAYTAPELLIDVPRANRSTDVYGMGLILYEMLAGYPAFANAIQSDFQIRENVLKGNVPPIMRPDLRTLPNVASKAINLRTKERYRNMLDLIAGLQETTPSIPEQKEARRINWQLISMIMLGIAFIMMLVIGAWACDFTLSGCGGIGSQ